MPKFRVYRISAEVIEVEADSPDAAAEKAGGIYWEEQESYVAGDPAEQFEVEQIA